MATHDAHYWAGIERTIAYICKRLRDPENVAECSFERGRIQWPDPNASMTGYRVAQPTKGETYIITINGGATVTDVPGPPQDTEE